MAESARRLMFLMGALYFLQTLVGNPGLHEQALRKFLKEVWQFSPLEMSAFFAILTIPWMIKPLYGFLSDFVPVFGYRRKSYFLFVASLAAVSYGLLSWIGASSELMRLLLFNAALGVAFSDVLCDAIMLEKGKPLNITEELQSWQWAALYSAYIIVSLSKGNIAEYFTLGEAFRLSMFAPMVMIPFVVFGFKEIRVSSQKDAAKNAWVGFKEALCSKPLWAVAGFIFFFMLSPNLGDPFYYYEKDILKFSDPLIGYIDAVGALFSAFGVLIARLALKRMTQDKMLKVVIITGVVGSLLYLFFRGIISAFVVSAVVGLISGITLLGVLTLAAKVCPKHVEAMVFAFLMSVYNFGARIGSLSGSALYEHVGYSWLIVISAVFTACMWFFLPLVRQKTNQHRGK